MEYKKDLKRIPLHLLSMPIIYSMIVPLVIFDIFLEIYHRSCFPLYGLPYVKRSEYIRIDRHKLKYLWWLDKFNCAYCGYANGVIGYAREIVARTEKYWCGVKHKKDPNFYEPDHHRDFIEYGDEKGYKKY